MFNCHWFRNISATLSRIMIFGPWASRAGSSSMFVPRLFSWRAWSADQPSVLPVLLEMIILRHVLFLLLICDNFLSELMERVFRAPNSGNRQALFLPPNFRDLSLGVGNYMKELVLLKRNHAITYNQRYTAIIATSWENWKWMQFGNKPNDNIGRAGRQNVIIFLWWNEIIIFRNIITWFL